MPDILRLFIILYIYMTARLELIRSLISEGLGVADIGTDHGYIPSVLALSGYRGNIIAADINPQPLESAIRNAREYGVEDRIAFVLSDGLDSIPPDLIDTIVIAGMGGDLICSILDRAEWVLNDAYHLILQPMTKPEILRYWLVNNGFTIECDIPLKDMGKLYSVIKASYTGLNTFLSDGELYTGSTNLIQSNLYARELTDVNIERIMKITVGLGMTSAQYYILDFYDGILNSLISIREELVGD